jgi:hypothetical protein
VAGGEWVGRDFFMVVSVESSSLAYRVVGRGVVKAGVVMT